MTTDPAAQCEICDDCNRVGHAWTEVRGLQSTTPVGFICTRCPIALKAVPVDALRVGDDVH